MTYLTDITGLASSAVAMAGLAWKMSGARMPGNYRIALAAMVAAVAWIPVDGLPLAAYVRGMIGDLSIPSLVLILIAMQRSLHGRTHHAGQNVPFTVRRERRTTGGMFVWLGLIVVAAAVLYPMALGAGCYDPYRLGYGNPWFLGVLMAVSFLAYFRRLWLPACIFPLAVLAWALGWYESTNLWDYLLDPWLATYATAALLGQVGQSLMAKRRI